MKVTDYYNEVSRRTDTDKTAINVADTKRVLAVGFDVLAEMDATEFADTLAKGLALAKKRQAKAKK